MGGRGTKAQRRQWYLNKRAKAKAKRESAAKNELRDKFNEFTDNIWKRTKPNSRALNKEIMEMREFLDYARRGGVSVDEVEQEVGEKHFEVFYSNGTTKVINMNTPSWPSLNGVAYVRAKDRFGYRDTLGLKMEHSELTEKFLRVYDERVEEVINQKIKRAARRKQPKYTRYQRIK